MKIMPCSSINKAAGMSLCVYIIMQTTNNGRLIILFLLACSSAVAYSMDINSYILGYFANASYIVL